MSIDTATTSSAELRNALVDKIIKAFGRLGNSMRPDVERALRTVPRELFTPGIPLEEAYADTAIITRRSEDGVNLSSISAPNMIAEMLRQSADALGELTGRHVLEIGSGGYNAALLRELVGPTGSVTTVDIDPEVTDRASTCLDAAGYNDVTVICADAEFEVEPRRSYDLIIVTVGAWDIPPAWSSQLTDTGVLVVPLRTLGMTRSWALRKSGGHLVSSNHLLCGFVPMQGAGESTGRAVPLADGVHLWLDEDDSALRHVDGDALEGVLDTDRAESWSQVFIKAWRPVPDLDLWLAARSPGFALLVASQPAVDSGLVKPDRRFGNAAFVDGPNLCYQAGVRPNEERTFFELGAYAHGPDATAAATRMTDQIRAWDAAGRPSPTLHVHPARTPAHALPGGLVVDKRHSRLVITFSTPE
ncbi:methyltransferase, FxLD system [Actinomadura craniellae]|uniref:Protein-L-isoaspartate O-methyltransferase n=1 Tax=Actinomadura craniellae TaxID=2231787 RepID=A0A365HD51_9ACTN|nr:methyltransferase, FxLD system [Actinomadura craniellae]RAY17017.1 methyltransferase, FxLD system [Actinomadura craniellae]